MDSVTSPPPGQTATHPLGVREPLPVVDLPEPEEVFGVPHLGRKEVVKFFFLNFMFDQLTGEALVQF
jgi:hypothetical protein